MTNYYVGDTYNKVLNIKRTLYFLSVCLWLLPKALSVITKYKVWADREITHDKDEEMDWQAQIKKRISSPVKHLRWSCFVKIANDEKPLTIFLQFSWFHGFDLKFAKLKCFKEMLFQLNREINIAKYSFWIKH